MKQIWAPWRMKYISKQDKKEEVNGDCLFCRKAGEDKDKENYIFLRGKTAFLILNLYPYSNGHIMAIPYRHVWRLSDLKKDELVELMELTRRATLLLDKIAQPHGFNLGMNLGKVAGAGIDTHLHFHIVPRWESDTNFMPVISDMRIIPEALDETYRKLVCAIKVQGAVNKK